MPTIYLYLLSSDYIYHWQKCAAMGQARGGDVHHLSALWSILVR
ncbi:hypothetical protein ETAE_2306 [Edwardsiella piscicida]|uniref:Uncharacterized protein n=1 Tax=Edwardsiella piscicida TaxID=1263550 RepID=A0AAU8PEA8_EDWPI|nr:hypothetical protein ETAE_2306 [Edwardsiella tarda EIB202]